MDPSNFIQGPGPSEPPPVHLLPNPRPCYHSKTTDHIWSFLDSEGSVDWSAPLAAMNELKKGKEQPSQSAFPVSPDLHGNVSGLNNLAFDSCAADQSLEDILTEDRVCHLLEMQVELLSFPTYVTFHIDFPRTTSHGSTFHLYEDREIRLFLTSCVV
jgi:hypothetical protein